MWLFFSINIQYSSYAFTVLKLRTEMGSVSTRRQPDLRAEKQPKATNVSSTQRKIPHPQSGFSWPRNWILLLINCTFKHDIQLTLYTKTIRTNWTLPTEDYYSVDFNIQNGIIYEKGKNKLKLCLW